MIMDEWCKSKHDPQILRDFILKYRKLKLHYVMCLVKVVMVVKKKTLAYDKPLII